MQALVTRTIASVGSLRTGSGTLSTRTSPASYITVARIPSTLGCLPVARTGTAVRGTGVGDRLKSQRRRGGDLYFASVTLARPETRYANADGVRIGYQVFGSGKRTLICVLG